MFLYNYLTTGNRPTGDVIEKSIGAFGRYHYWLCFLVFLSKMPMSMHQMAIIFLAPKVSYTCDGVLNKCPCDNPEYDRSMFTKSIIMQFNLICSRQWLASFAQTTFQFGTLLGSVFFGMAADRYGRRPPFVVAGILELVSGISASYTISYWGFLACRFICGLAVGGTMVIGFVVISEFIGVKHRTLVSSLYQIPSTFGHLVTPGFGYYFRDYHEYQFAISIPASAMLLYICFLPETPRWLMAAKRNEEAINVLERVAKINRRPVTNIRTDVLAHSAILHEHHLKKGTLLDLFKTPNLRKRILAMAYSWLTCGYCFYGVAQYISHLSGNVFMNVAASALCTTLGTLLSIGLLRIMGRRNIIVICHTICVVCFIMLAITPHGTLPVICACLGIVSEFIVFIVVYLFTSEMFPTVVRNAAMGFSSMSARIGSMISPFVIDLGSIESHLPPIVFAIVPAVAMFVTFLMPETKDCALLTTLQEGEEFKSKTRSTASNR